MPLENYELVECVHSRERKRPNGMEQYCDRPVRNSKQEPCSGAA